MFRFAQASLAAPFWKPLSDVVRYRDLLLMLTWRDICIKYKQSLLGLAWAILMPTAIVAAGMVVKLAFAAATGARLTLDDLMAVSVKAVPWAFFVAAIRFSTNSLIGNANLVTKIYFPKVILPLSAVLSQLVDFLVAACVLTILLLVLGMKLSLTMVWAPLLMIALVLLTAGAGNLLSAAGLFFRDVKYLVEVFLTFAIFFTPVFYDVSLFGAWGELLLLNPVAPLLEGIGASVRGGSGPGLAWIAYSVVVALSVFGGSLLCFRRLEPAFAECI